MAEINPDTLKGICPRCGQLDYVKFAAGSRVAVARDIEICGKCGELEAQRDMAGLPPIPPADWPVEPDELGREYALLFRGLRDSTYEVATWEGGPTGEPVPTLEEATAMLIAFREEEGS